MKKLLLLTLTTILLTGSLAQASSDNWGYNTLDRIMDGMGGRDATVNTMNTILFTVLGPELSVTSVVTGATNVMLGEDAAKMALIEKAAPSAVAFLEDEKSLSEDLIVASFLLIEEKGQVLGRENVEHMIATKELTLKSLAQEIINR